MLKYNHAFRRLSLVSARADRKTACIECESRSQKIAVVVSPDGLVVRAGETVRLGAAEIAGIGVRKTKPPLWPWTAAIIAVAVGSVFVLRGQPLSWAIVADGLLFTMVWFAREERTSVCIETLCGSRITLGFHRTTPAEERQIARTVEAMRAIVPQTGVCQ